MGHDPNHRDRAQIFVTMSYKAFLSCSHAAMASWRRPFQHALHRIAKPWYRLRTMRVFRDQTNLGTSPGLWPSIESALREAEFLYLNPEPMSSLRTQAD
jgi:hypothetical protein